MKNRVMRQIHIINTSLNLFILFRYAHVAKAKVALNVRNAMDGEIIAAVITPRR